jgi:hypothetical protein
MSSASIHWLGWLAIAQRAEQSLDLLDAERVDDGCALRRRLAHRTHRVDRQLALADRVGADRLQDGERLADSRRPESVALERLAQRLHRGRRQLAQFEVPYARQQVAVPDLGVGGERVAGQAPASVVGPPVVLDELAKDDAASTELIQRSSAPGEAQVGLVVDGVIGGVELLASAFAADRIEPAHAERPDPAPRVPASLDATRNLGLRRPLTHRIPISSPTRSGVGMRWRLRPPLTGTGVTGATSGRRAVRRVERRANQSSIASDRTRKAP